MAQATGTLVRPIFVSTTGMAKKSGKLESGGSPTKRTRRKLKVSEEDMDLSRRNFLVGSAAAAATMAAPNVFAVHQDRAKLRVGLIGSGGRGSGAIRDCMNADPSVELYAIGDVFADRMNGCVTGLMKDLPARTNVGDRKFVGFDAYQKVIDSGVDIVILTTPPAFRPKHFSAAIAAGKHVFMEKPVAVDPTGIRMVIEAAKLAKSKNLTVVAGTQRRHDPGYQDTIKRIRDGQMGDVVAMNCYWNQGGLWMNPRQESWSDMEWQLRNWLYFAWLSGDHIVEQHVHNLDVCNWVMGAHPVKAMSLAGRQVRTGAEYGHIFDHFATEYTYENGVRMISMCRQIDGCASNVSEYIVGTKGNSDANTRIRGEAAWRYEGRRPNPYVEEHKRLIKSIQGNEAFNEGEQVAHSTMTAILGRMSAYTGLEVTWEQGMASTMDLVPAKCEFGKIDVPAVAVPGQTKLP